ncbi:MAG: galactosyldiacylglycerol synthase [Chloroflexi bacterium HGW-Chloroflexi-8]|jgi:1,2-diacylglycerol 3-beta-galactosyltransferase|nr:MAG: galactosyldiacylglycerol synthase [Chloroflexi bacterium HGW-Chloroflexi-8]
MEATKLTTNKPRILFLFSDTGGGHRSAAEAIIEALELEFPGRFEFTMVDIFRDYAPLPLNFAPEIYPTLSRMPRMWELGYKVSDGTRRTKIFYNAIWPYLRRSLRKLLKDHPADLIVSVHQLVNSPLLRARVTSSSRFVTVVTDLVSTHSAWYHPGADLVIVPTEAAKEKALKNGLPIEKIKVLGQPVAERYTVQFENVEILRSRLKWKQKIPTFILVGGGEGMGNIEKYAHAINDAKLECQLIIVSGRNQTLKKYLENMNWNIPCKIYGFVKEMPEFMHAADVLITKAGPGTISEAFIAGLPLILFSKMPGQEDGNVDYVVKNNAGVWTPDPEKMINCINNWLENPELLNAFKKNSEKLARPEATRKIARELAKQVQQSLDDPTKLRV